MLQMLFAGTVGVSIAASAVILVFLLCAAPIQKRYAARWRYWLWLFLAVRMLVPWNPDLTFGWLKLGISEVIPREAFAERLHSEVLEMPWSVLLEPSGESQQGNASETGDPMPDGAEYVPYGTEAADGAEAAQGLSLMELLALLWLCGVFVVFGVNLSGYLRFRRRLMKSAGPLESAQILALVEDIAHGCCGLSRKRLRLLRSDETLSPMVIGFFNPCLVLPDVEYGEELAFVLKHELTHYGRNDTCYKLLLVTACSVHWFNPFAWLMVRQARVDLELSCDEAVVAREPYVVRRAYTEAIVAAMSRQCGEKTALTMQWNSSMKLMKRRLKHILLPSQNKNGLAFVSLMLALLLAVSTILACGAREVYAASTDDESIWMDWQGVGYGHGTVAAEDILERDYLKRHFYPELEEFSYAKGEIMETQCLSTEEQLEIESVVRDFLGAWMRKDVDGLCRQSLFYDGFLDGEAFAKLLEVMSKVENCDAVPLEILSVTAASGVQRVEVFRRIPEDERFGYVDMELEKAEDGWTVCGCFYTELEQHAEVEAEENMDNGCLHRGIYDEISYHYGRGLDYHMVSVPDAVDEKSRPVKARCDRFYVKTVHHVRCDICHASLAEYEEEHIVHESPYCLHNHSK